MTIPPPKRDKLPDHYGDPFHLKNCRIVDGCYDALLCAIRETLEDRGTLMPFVAEDVFGRHSFLGGVHALRDMTAAERKKFLSMKQTFLDEDESEESDPELLLGLSDVSEHLSRSDLFEEIEQANDTEDFLDRRNLQRLKDFFRFALENGDIYLVSLRECSEQSSSRRSGYALKEGGRFEQPPIGELAHYRQKTEGADLPQAGNIY